MKKKIITMMGLALISMAGTAQTSAPATPASEQQTATKGILQFKEETHDYGEVPEGPIAECNFEFENTGKAAISITQAQGSCGCTVPDWPHYPILPGEKGTIHVKYSTQGRIGAIQKEVYVLSDAQQGTVTLHIKGMVKQKIE